MVLSYLHGGIMALFKWYTIQNDIEQPTGYTWRHTTLTQKNGQQFTRCHIPSISNKVKELHYKIVHGNVATNIIRSCMPARISPTLHPPSPPTLHQLS